MGEIEVAVDTAFYLALLRIHRRFAGMLDLEHDRFKARRSAANNAKLAAEYDRQIEIMKHAEKRGADIVELAKTKHLPTIIVRYLSYLQRLSFNANDIVEHPSEAANHALAYAALSLLPATDKLLTITRLGRPYPQEAIRRANAIYTEEKAS